MQNTGEKHKHTNRKRYLLLRVESENIPCIYLLLISQVELFSAASQLSLLQQEPFNVNLSAAVMEAVFCLFVFLSLIQGGSSRGVTHNLAQMAVACIACFTTSVNKSLH